MTHVVATDVTDKTRWARSQVGALAGRRLQGISASGLLLIPVALLPQFHVCTWECRVPCLLPTPNTLCVPPPQGKFVVAPNWLWCSAYTWRRADEAEFPVRPGGSAAAAQAAAPRSEAEDVAQALAAAGGGEGAEQQQQQQPADGPAAAAQPAAPS